MFFFLTEVLWTGNLKSDAEFFFISTALIPFHFGSGSEGAEQDGGK